jgi:hypothetical protein
MSRSEYFKGVLELFPSFGSYLGYKYDDKSENSLDKLDNKLCIFLKNI